MSNRRDSLRRLKRLNRATRGHDFERHYTMAGEEEGGGRSFLWIFVAVIIAVFVVFGVIMWMKFGHSGEEKVLEEPQVAEDPVPEPTMPPYEPGETEEEVPDDDDEEMPGFATFLQGPKNWKKKYDWSGEWGDKTFDGGRFGGFGCGLCVMANFYCSLTPYQCSPVDMYKYAKKVTGYEGGSAIDWPFIKKTLGTLGFTVDTGRKPKKLKKFRELVKGAKATMVVISSYDDNSYWKDTPGHYVTLLAYRDEDDCIYLGDSGKVNHNRSWIPLKTVYKAIKKSNSLHYMRVLSYDKTLDKWKHKKINGKWIKPTYWKG